MDEQFEYQKSELQKIAMNDYETYGRDDEFWTVKNVLIVICWLGFGYIFSLGLVSVLELLM